MLPNHLFPTHFFLFSSSVMPVIGMHLGLPSKHNQPAPSLTVKTCGGSRALRRLSAKPTLQERAKASSAADVRHRSLLLLVLHRILRVRNFMCFGVTTTHVLAGSPVSYEARLINAGQLAVSRRRSMYDFELPQADRVPPTRQPPVQVLRVAVRSVSGYVRNTHTGYTLGDRFFRSEWHSLFL
jgi:hypothetical protein